MDNTLKEYLDLIEKHRKGRNRMAGNPERVKYLETRAKENNLEFPDDYKEFLERYNGYNLDGLYIFAADEINGNEGFLIENVTLRSMYKNNEPESKFTFYGTKDDSILYFNNNIKKYCYGDEIDLNPGDDEMFDTFTDLLIYALNNYGMIDNLKKLN
jgi:hypothetical protein